MSSTPLTELTKPHKEVIRQLQLRGLEVSREVPFDPYKVDIYLPKYHAAVEVDGPDHHDEKDERRDNLLFELYYLLVVRIKAENAAYPEKWWARLASRLNDLLPSARWRKDYCDQVQEGL